MADPLKIGAVPYVNARPLVFGLEDKATVTYAVPAKLAGMLRTGEVDVALVPFVEYFSGTPYTIIPDIAIASHGQIKSVLLICEADPYDLKKIAVDADSRSSTALLKIIVADHFRLKPEYVEMDVAKLGVQGALGKGADSVMMIGDPALQADPGAHFVVDLGEEWTILTNSSFVYAAWLARDGVDLDAATALLAEAKEQGKAHLTTIAQEAAASGGLSETAVSEYLHKYVQYDLSKKERQGIDFFKKFALKHHLIENDEDIRIHGQ